MTKAIIFDFDGVLVLSDPGQFKVIQQTAKKYNVIIKDNTFPRLIGKTSLAFLTEILSAKDKPLLSVIHDDYEKEFRGNITKYVEPIDFSLNYIKSYRGLLVFALASMSSRKVITMLTNHFGIFNKFKIIVSREDIKNHKPNPEIYLKTAQELGISSGDCLVIEDSTIGVKAVLNAQMKCYVLLNGLNRKEEFSKLPISGFIRSEKDFYNIK